MPAPPPESEPAMIRIRAVDVILRVFDPLPGAKLSMCTASSLGRQIQRKRSRGGPNGLANVVDQPLDQGRVVAFGHYPDQRLGPRLANDKASPAFELTLGSGDALAHTIRLQRLARPAEAHVLEQL